MKFIKKKTPDTITSKNNEKSNYQVFKDVEIIDEGSANALGFFKGEEDGQKIANKKYIESGEIPFKIVTIPEEYLLNETKNYTNEEFKKHYLSGYGIGFVSGYNKAVEETNIIENDNINKTR